MAEFEDQAAAARGSDPGVNDVGDDAGSPGLQMAASVVLPGAAAVRRRPLVGIVLLLLGVAIPIVFAVWAFAERDDPIGLALDNEFLIAVMAIGLVVVVARLLAVFEVADAFRGTSGIGWKTGVATVVVLALGSPMLFASFKANEVRDTVADVFEEDDGEPLFVPGQTVDDLTGASGENAELAESEDAAGMGRVVDADTDQSVRTVLLLGGDAGPGRWGMRTDSMILVSIHKDSGRTAMISIPRNLMRLHFPPGTPLAEQFPDGFNDLTNAIFTYLVTHEDVMAQYGESSRLTQAVALAQGIGYSLDIQIDDYALVNMQGFTQIIDAVGGVTLDLDKRVPLPKTIPGERPLPEAVGPGKVDMDGALAIAFARSRKADSDYQRMFRQRQLLAALGSQVSTSEAVRGFNGVVGALDDSLRTSLSASEFSALLDQLGDGNSVDESVGLTPPLITPGRPDYTRIREIVDAVENYVATGQPSGYAT
jgi:LCP family protein required for cell wall assembly